MTYEQALKDYLALREIAVGDPEDTGWTMEDIAASMLKNPTKANAKHHLCHLIELYHERGNAEGRPLHSTPVVDDIFQRHLGT